MNTTLLNLQHIRNDAFVSYSHAADDALAPALQKALQAFARPWHQMRSLRVFRDETGLAVTPDHWDDIAQQLSRSDYFVLLASPDAARASWVRLELQTWLATPGAEKRLLIVLTDGDIVWSPHTCDFDWTRTTALPTLLSEVFAAEPKVVNLRQVRRARDLSVRNPLMLTAVASIYSRITRRPLEEVIGKEIQTHKVRIRLAASAAVAIMVASGFAGYGWQQNSARELANHQRQIREAVMSSQADLLSEGSARR
jgi:hypothetical protein